MTVEETPQPVKTSPQPEDRILLEGPHSRLREARLLFNAVRDFIAGFRTLGTRFGGRGGLVKSNATANDVADRSLSAGLRTDTEVSDEETTWTPLSDEELTP